MDVEGGSLGILLGTWALRWTMPRIVLGDTVMLHQLYWAAKPSNMGVDVDGLANPLHHPTTCSRQTWGHGFLSSAALSHRAAVGGGAFQGGARPLGLDI
jgi:hypothetical protein